MARASVRTLLPLDTFARIAGTHPLHFNQTELHGLPDMGDNSTVRTCGMPIFQYQWQTANRMGREDVAQAIAQAEQLMNAELGFKMAPDWTVKDQVSAARPANVGLFSGNSRNIRGQYNAIRASEGYIISGGVEAKSLIGNANVVYSDPDADDYSELATITIATTVTDINEIALYYPGESGATEWEIRPLKKVTIAGGTVTIECYRQQLVVPELLTTLFPIGVDGSDDANFLQTVDIYRHYNDPSAQAQLIYDDAYCTNCEGDGCEACGFGVQTGCLVVRDHRLGMVSYQPGSWSGGAFSPSEFAAFRAPDRLSLNYLAGWRDQRAARPLRDMDLRWAQAITYFALSFLSRPICACEAFETNMKHWREDLAHNISERGISSSFRIPNKKFDNPFGTTRGALFAWEAIRNLRLGAAADNA